MKTRYLLIPFALSLGLGLTLTLLWTLGDPGTPADAAMRTEPDLLVRSVAEGSTAAGPGKAPNAPTDDLLVCDGCVYTTIQSAVDAANDGDVIKVATGVYSGVQARAGVTQVVYISKSVTIRGGYTISFTEPPDPDANPTILDAQVQGRVLYISEGVSTTLEGLTFTGGNDAGLGGCPWSNETCGSGVYAISAAVRLFSNVIINNVSSHPGVTNGGGVFLWNMEAGSRVSDNLIRSNAAEWGAGVFILDSNDITLSGNTVVANTADLGGGLVLFNSPATLDGNTITANTASTEGGGLWLYSSNATLINNIVADNQTTGAGSGLYVSGSAPQLLHTTLAHNSGGDGSGIYVAGLSTVSLINTILVSHTVGITVVSGTTTTLESTLWGAGVWANDADWVGGGAIITTTDIYGDPAFVSGGDYHITVGSAARDAGVDVGVTTDIDGQPRPQGTDHDIGAHELLAMTIDFLTGSSINYVDPQGLTTTVKAVSGSALAAVTPLRRQMQRWPATVEAVSGSALETVTLVYTPVSSPTHPLPPGSRYLNHDFNLDAYCYWNPNYVYLPLVLRNDGALAHIQVSSLPPLIFPVQRSVSNLFDSQELNPCPSSFQFEKPLTIIIHYSDADVAEVDEGNLRLDYWIEKEYRWEDAAATCTPASIYIHDLDGNVLSVPICHLTCYGMR